MHQMIKVVPYISSVLALFKWLTLWLFTLLDKKFDYVDCIIYHKEYEIAFIYYTNPQNFVLQFSKSQISMNNS
jgi:hypothetical protein